MEPLDSPWYVIHSLQSLAGGCYQQPFPHSMSVTKWTDNWIHLHKYIIEIDNSACFTWRLDGQPLLQAPLVHFPALGTQSFLSHTSSEHQNIQMETFHLA